MADERRPERPDSDRPRAARPTSRGSSAKGAGGGRGARSGGGSQGGQRRPDRSGNRSDSRSGDRSAEQATYDGPPLDETITGKELDRSVLGQLRGLPEKLAARVARHLVAAGQLLDSDPATAYLHTLAARGRAARVAVVREACGEAAYAAGEYAAALSELRAARRINGAGDYLHIMADCERALGRPEKALTLAKSLAVASLSADLQAEMTIVAAGARADLGDVDSALRTLEAAPLRSKARADWVARLRYAYADMLLTAGRGADALEWFHRTAGVDGNGATDAADRIAELEGLSVVDTTDGEDTAD